jgi:hypothetical protein
MTDALGAMLHRDVTCMGALEAWLCGRQARKSVSINFSTFVDAAGVTAKIDGMACPSISALEVRPPKVVKAKLSHWRELFRMDVVSPLSSKELPELLFKRCSGWLPSRNLLWRGPHSRGLRRGKGFSHFGNHARMSVSPLNRHAESVAI